MTPTVIALSLAIVALIFVAAPFLRGKGRATGDDGPGSATPRRERGAGPVESALPDPLEELELDRAMGKVSDDDYERMRRTIEAARERSVVAVSAPAPATPTVAPSTASVAERAEAMIRAARADVVACVRCGERPEPAARYCSRCGSAIKA